MRRAFGVLLVVAAFAACSGSNVTISGPGEDGKISVTGDAPPVDARVGKNGVEQAPTPTPGQPTPVYPLETPVPAATPRPGSSGSR